MRPIRRLVGKKFPTNNFDGLRLVGALLVLVSHQFAIQGRVDPSFLGVSPGEAGVAIFFGISGYLVTGSWFADPNIFRFFAKRFLRLWPALAVTVVTLWACCHLLPLQGLRQLRVPLAADLFLTQNISLVFGYWDWSPFFSSNPVGFLDRSLWTIPVEVRCYLALGFACFLLERKARWLVAAITLPFFMPGWPQMLAACFLAGSAMKLWRHGFVLALVVASVAAGTGDWTFALLLCIAPLAVFAGSSSWPMLCRAGERGDFSYGLYLWGWPVAQVGVALWGKDCPWLLLWTLAATGAVAWLSWHLIEAPALKLKPSRPSS